MTTDIAGHIPQLTLGWRLKMSLADDKLAAGEMADYLGVSRQTLSRWMNDAGAPPKRAYLMQWAIRTGVPLTWLETGETPDDGGGPGGLSYTPRDSNPEPAVYLASAA